jgi:hypothetical protein
MTADTWDYTVKVFGFEGEVDPEGEIDPAEYGARKLPATIPPFEGQEVSATKVSFASGTNLEVEDRVYRSEDIVRFVVEARVAGINHKTNEKTGLLERVHSLKVVDVTEIPYELDLDDLLNKDK